MMIFKKGTWLGCLISLGVTSFLWAESVSQAPVETPPQTIPSPLPPLQTPKTPAMEEPSDAMELSPIVSKEDDETDTMPADPTGENKSGWETLEH